MSPPPMPFWPRARTASSTPAMPMRSARRSRANLRPAISRRTTTGFSCHRSCTRISIPPCRRRRPSPMELNVFPGGATRHLHGTPLLFQSATHGTMHFVGGENSALRAWSIAADGRTTYLAGANEIASPQSPRPPGGMPGWSITLAANNGTDGIIVAMVPYQDSNMILSPRPLPGLRRAEFRHQSGWLQTAPGDLGQRGLGPGARLHASQVQPSDRLERPHLSPDL